MEVFLSIIKKFLKVVSKILVIALIALVALVIVIINPFYMPVIFRNNYPEWFAKHPLLTKIIDKIYWGHLEK